MNKHFVSRLGLLASLLLTLCGLGASSASAAAEPPIWRLDTIANTTAAPGETMQYLVELRNMSRSAVDTSVSPATFRATMPPGMTLSSVVVVPFALPCNGGLTVDPQGFTCVENTTMFPSLGAENFVLEVEVEPGAAEGTVLTPRFSIEGGDPSDPSGPKVTTADPTTVAAAPLGFGIDAFDGQVDADAAGTPLTQAAAHPYEASTSIDFNTATNPAPLKGPAWPSEPVRDVFAELPPGFVGNPAAASQCTLAELVGSQETNNVRSDCSPESQVGVTFIRFLVRPFPFLSAGAGFGPLPVYAMPPPPGVPARFGFNVASTVVVLDATVRSDGDYGLTVSSRYIGEGVPVAGTTVTFWGVPASADHDRERGCPGLLQPWEKEEGEGKSCPSTAKPQPFLRNPTACTAPGVGLTTSVRADSWEHPGVFDEASFESHLPKGYPYPRTEWGVPQGPDGCEAVPFEPQLEASPTTESADSPSGLDVHLRVPQNCWEHQEEICQSDLRDAEVTLPQGMSLNPSSASGLGACSPEQVGLTSGVGTSPIRFDEAPVSCPDSAKIGTVEIATPLLARRDSQGKPLTDSGGKVIPEPLEGSVYLAEQSDNPFGSLLAMYIVAEGSGVVVKQAGEIKIGPDGRMRTVFKDAPQNPFSDLHVSLFGGPRAPLRTPPTCGTFAVTAKLTPWSGTPAVSRAGAFEITSCPNSGFDPKLSAGTENPLAATYSPFSLRLTREDGTEELAGLKLDIPKGLLANLKGIPYCPDATLAAISGALGTGAAQIAQPSCPAASQVGTLTAGAGAGPTPFYSTTGKAYWAGPYKGAPVSLAVVVPAVAGPFDLGSVVVRNGVQVNPETAQITAVADRFPTALHGIPLDLRDVRVQLTRPNYTLNPTSCDPMSFEADITGAQGANAHRSQRFQVAGCDRLGFKPRLSLKLKGDTKRSGNPALTAVMRPRPGNANLSRIQVALPHSQFLAQSHIRTICTRVQFAADACPKGSIYGKVTAISPILDYSLSGNVYLRSSSNPLPDMVLALRGPAYQPIEIDAVGRIDSKDGGIRTTFDSLPDAPLTKVVVKLPAGKKSLLENSTNICRGTHRAIVRMDAHNAAVRELQPKLEVGGCRKRGGGEDKGRHARR